MNSALDIHTALTQLSKISQQQSINQLLDGFYLGYVSRKNIELSLNKELFNEELNKIFEIIDQLNRSLWRGIATYEQKLKIYSDNLLFDKKIELYKEDSIYEQQVKENYNKQQQQKQQQQQQQQTINQESTVQGNFCNICGELLHLKFNNSCQHQFHINCLNNYIQNHNQLPIKCPCCDYQIQRSDLGSDQQQLNYWDVLEQKNQQESLTYHCKKVNCGELIQINNEQMKCVKCDEIYCIKCKELFHQQPCQKNDYTYEGSQAEYRVNCPFCKLEKITKLRSKYYVCECGACFNPTCRQITKHRNQCDCGEEQSLIVRAINKVGKYIFPIIE